MEDLKAFYMSVIRSTLEVLCTYLACIQKQALQIMLPELSYEEVLVECNLKTIKGHREDM
jgi:hypothetical protein